MHITPSVLLVASTCVASHTGLAAVLEQQLPYGCVSTLRLRN